MIKKFTARRGYTLIELLVTISIIGLLAAIIIPSVQQAAEAARRARCANNLRQIAVANATYESAFGVFPCLRGSSQLVELDPTPHQFSLYTQIMPGLGENSLYNSINFSVQLQDPYLFPSTSWGAESNFTTMGASLAVFLCPTDSHKGMGGWTGPTNYRANLGYERWFTNKNSILGGPFGMWGNAPASATIDGLSCTSALSEKLRGRVNDARLDSRVDMVYGYFLGLPFTLEEAVQFCRAKDGHPRGFATIGGLTWFVGSLSQTCYNHLLEPNSATSDCVGSGANPIAGLIAARSDHPGGVNAAMADGSVRFVKNSVHYEVWRALGTGAGGETIGSDGF